MALQLPAPPDHHAQPGEGFQQSGWELLTPSQSSPATSPSHRPQPPLCSAEEKESTFISPKRALVWVPASPSVEPAVSRPLGCSPLAGGTKPSWRLKPHCYKPWCCCRAVMLHCGYRDIPERHPLVPGWKRAQSVPERGRTARSQPAVEPVPRASPTDSTPVLWLPSPLISRLTMRAAP